MGSTRSKWRGSQLAFYDGSTFETTLPFAPMYLYDDFEGTALNTDIWTDLEVGGATTTAPLASVAAFLQAANHANEAAAIYGKDDKQWNIDKGLIFECSLTVTVAPTLTSEIAFGMTNDSYGADSMLYLQQDEVAKYAIFGFYPTVGAGLVPVIRTDDGANSGIISTGLTVVVNIPHIYRIDFTESADVKFYIDGIRYATSTTFVMNTAANLAVQPWIGLNKKNDVTTSSVCEFLIDYVRIWQATR